MGDARRRARYASLSTITRRRRAVAPRRRFHRLQVHDLEVTHPVRQRQRGSAVEAHVRELEVAPLWYRDKHRRLLAQNVPGGRELLA
jgi:hypothetical protein